MKYRRKTVMTVLLLVVVIVVAAIAVIGGYGDFKTWLHKPVREANMEDIVYLLLFAGFILNLYKSEKT